ncbi:alpha/beta hydrolase [Gordonia rubripertincta]|uniref:Alpha/beta hydrolase n=1 Tax=Gordonia rubripertincta TaxID=36822 RepID=A0ABT4MWM6_GORRU|nr:alpha/beta hydrolase [Gordonia rubripertincta]MCZ4551419.1 alpha/beta hydrolase [Gordonia rubripertincta]
MTLEQARGVTAGLKDMYGPGPDMVKAELREVDLGGREISIHFLVPNDDPGGLIVYYHGGGWTIGTIAEFETLGRQLAERTGCVVALVDYRLAPEAPYPAPVDDAWDALVWISENLEDIAGRRLPLIVAGDSAGGTLAAVVSQRARGGGPDISLQVLVYPVTDCDFETASYLAPENQLMLSRDTMLWFWNHYAPDSVRTDPEASPARARDLSALPPAILVTGEHDVLLDEGLAYGAALKNANVPVSHRHFAGQMHGFFTMVNLLPGSAEAIDFVSSEVVRHLSSTGQV